MSGNHEILALVVGGDTAVQRLFKDRGYLVTLDPDEDFDIAVFTGGEDICPLVYGQKPHKSVKFNLSRDAFELNMLRRIPYYTPKIGICRGAQLLNIYNGGSMYQDVDGHTGGNHEVKLLDQTDQPIVEINSFHHQMMIPSKDNCMVVGVAHNSCKRVLLDYAGKELTFSQTKAARNRYEEAEIINYYFSNSFCFQGHPEYGHSITTQVFWDYADTYVLDQVRSDKQKAKNRDKDC